MTHHRREVVGRWYKLQKEEHRREATQEREPELLPAVCPACGAVLGLVVAGGEVWCRDCGTWAPADDLSRIPAVLTR